MEFRGQFLRTSADISLFSEIPNRKRFFIHYPIHEFVRPPLRCHGLRELSYPGDPLALWNEMDTDGSGEITRAAMFVLTPSENGFCFTLFQKCFSS